VAMESFFITKKVEMFFSQPAKYQIKGTTKFDPLLNTEFLFQKYISEFYKN
jgi:hypothetical protein